MQTHKSLLTADEAAGMLTAVGYEISTETLRRWARTGRLPVVRKPGGIRARMLFRREDIEALLVADSGVA
jgi:predicted site-specific integrase-resolvase